LARPGTPTSSACPAKDRHEQLVEHFLLADDDLAEFPAHLLVGAAQGFEQLHVRGLGRVIHEGVRKAGECGGVVDARGDRAVNRRTLWYTLVRGTQAGDG
jgi:hypothetical protein